MLFRVWRGVTRKDAASQYVSHLKTSVIPELEQIDGFLGIDISHREISDGLEFLIISKWESREHILSFAGEDIDRAVVPPEAQKLMVRFESEVQHFDCDYGSTA